MKTTPWKSEWDRLQKTEAAYLKKGAEKKASAISRKLEEKVPAKLRQTLDAAFEKSFWLILEKGTGVIEKTYKRDELDRNYKVNEFALGLMENKKSLRVFSRQANAASSKNIIISGAKGIGLGVFGIGIPDIPVFIGMILKSIYEIALQYGYSYDSVEERYFILTVIATAMSYGDDLTSGDEEVNAFIESGGYLCASDYNERGRISSASSALSTEVLCMKFLQGIPIVGVVGGVFDAVVVGKILKYARIKYNRRFLFDRRYGKK